MKVVYCANCGERLNIWRKALPKYATIVDVVEHHECGDIVKELDLTPVSLPSFTPPSGKNKFVQKLNDLSPLPSTINPDLRDRRFDKQEKTTAPLGVRSVLESVHSEVADSEEEGNEP